jgi:hypothetical protein
MAQEILKFSQLNTGNLDKINAMMAELYAGAEGSGGTLQAAKFDDDGTLLWSSEPGWSAVLNATGDYTITFPTAAPSANEQSVTANSNIAGDSGTAWPVGLNTMTATTVDLTIETNTGTNTSVPFSIQRVV